MDKKIRVFVEEVDEVAEDSDGPLAAPHPGIKQRTRSQKLFDDLLRLPAAAAISDTMLS
jgi:hypothetical protein